MHTVSERRARRNPGFRLLVCACLLVGAEGARGQEVKLRVEWSGLDRVLRSNVAASCRSAASPVR